MRQGRGEEETEGRGQEETRERGRGDRGMGKRRQGRGEEETGERAAPLKRWSEGGRRDRKGGAGDMEGGRRQDLGQLL